MIYSVDDWYDDGGYYWVIEFSVFFIFYRWLV